MPGPVPNVSNNSSTDLLKWVFGIEQNNERCKTDSMLVSRVGKYRQKIHMNNMALSRRLALTLDAFSGTSMLLEPPYLLLPCGGCGGG